jgi:hypothetical protein
MTKSAFDQTPNLTETFDQVKRSSESENPNVCNVIENNKINLI